MNTQENNKLITEFMGWKIALGTKDEYSTTHAITKYIDTPLFSHNYNDKELSVETEHRLDKMLFDSSWDWLMPVVVKCFNVYDDAYNTNVFNSDNQQFNLNDALLLTNIDALYNAVIEFIKWYNKNKK